MFFYTLTGKEGITYNFENVDNCKRSPKLFQTAKTIIWETENFNEQIKPKFLVSAMYSEPLYSQIRHFTGKTSDNDFNRLYIMTMQASIKHISLPQWLLCSGEHETVPIQVRVCLTFDRWQL